MRSLSGPHRFRRVAAAAVMLAVALPVALTALAAVDGTRERQRSVTLAAEARAAGQAALDLQQRVFDVRDRLAVAATGSALLAASVTKDRDALARALAEFEPLLGSDVRYVFYQDLRGNLLAASPPAPELVGLNFAHRDYFAGVTRTWSPYVSEVYTTAFVGNPPASAIAVPVRDAAGTPNGIVVATLDLTNAARWLAPLLATFEDAYLIDQRGRLLARASRPGEGILADLSADPFVGAAMAGGARSVEARDPFAGETRLLASAVVPDVGWQIMLVGSPAVLDEQLAPVLAGFAGVLAVLAIVLLAGAVALGSLADRVLRQRDALATVNGELEAAGRHKSEFLANMSHELRTPLNAILGFSDLLDEQLRTAVSERQRRYLQNIHAAGAHLLGLIDDVLDLSKVEAGRIELRRETMTVHAIVEPVLSTTRAAADAADVRFDATIESATVAADVGRLRQMLYNLLSNAVKFTPPQGHVSLRVWSDARDLHAEVADSGIGIPADRQARVFGVFERVNEDRSESKGTGLGLALTKRLAELHGGMLSFTSREGVGTTFRLLLPGAVSVAGSGGHVLVVEDDPRSAELTLAVAAAAGFRSEVATTVDAALAAALRQRPVAVLLDLELANERGETVLRELRAGLTTREIPIAILSAEDDDGYSRALGADEYFTKPLDRERLMAWLLRVAAPAAVSSAA